MEINFDPEMAEIVPLGKTASFSMGGRQEKDEKPVHLVNLTVPYAMSKYEISNEQFCQVMNWALAEGYAVILEGDVWDAAKTCKYLGIKNLSEGNLQEGIEIVDGRLSLKAVEDLKSAKGISSGDFPVHGVTWYGACAFCNFLSLIKGLEPVYDLVKWECDWEKNGYRLPTEAEWTYAAKGHTQNEFAWGNDLSGAVCTWSKSKRIFGNGLTPVGFYDGKEKSGMATVSNASPFGVFDLTGNVWEWCWDWYGSSYFSVSPPDDPRGPQSGETRLPWASKATRVWKGGGLLAPPEYLRVDMRWSACPDQCYGELGFRVVKRIIP